MKALIRGRWSGAAGTLRAGVVAGALWGLVVVGFALLREARSGGPSPAGLVFPVEGAAGAALSGRFDDARGRRLHGAVDVPAPRGARVRALAAGTVVRLSDGGAGGIAVEQLSDDGRYCFYYAHLDGYAPGLAEGRRVAAGETLGYVGSSGNASDETPHLHLAVLELAAGQECWEGTLVDPAPLLGHAR